MTLLGCLTMYGMHVCGDVQLVCVNVAVDDDVRLTPAPRWDRH